MNYTQIQTDYPKAFAKWYEYSGFEPDEEQEDEHIDVILKDFAEGMDKYEVAMYDRRDLYDFFDENGIIINTYFSFFTDDTYGYTIFDTAIYERRESQIVTNAIFESRITAESAAFTKAFEILNDKL